MAEENQDGQEKTEEPSQRKIDKHKEDGKVLSSKEMFVFTGIAGALLLMYAFPFGARALLFEWGDLFVFSGNDKLDDLPATKSLQALFFIMKISYFFNFRYNFAKKTQGFLQKTIFLRKALRFFAKL